MSATVVKPAPSRRRRRRRGGGAKPQVAPTVAAPKASKAAGTHALRIGVGVIVLRGDTVLLVRERGRWSLPKGGLDPNELLAEGARREALEETGLEVEIRDLAFTLEFHAQTWGHHLQFFFFAREVGGELGPRDPDNEVQEAKFVPLRELREYLRFRPRLLSLETWLRERRARHFVYNLDKEPAMLRPRRRAPTADEGVKEAQP